MQGLELKLKERLQKLLDDGTVDCVIGWTKGEFIYDVTPAIFTKESGLDGFVYNSFCGANLSKYLVSQITSDKKFAVVLKPCDTYSMNQLITEHRVNRENIYIVGVGCSGHLDIDKIKAQGVSGITNVVDNDNNIIINSIYGDASMEKAVVLLSKCQSCKGAELKIADEIIGEGIATPACDARFDGVKKLEAMTAEQRFAFWKKELSKCIRCNACRNICPACTCRTCVFDNARSNVAAKANATEFEEKMFHIIRAFHVAGRCTDCGECSRVCPQGIPLHLLNRKFIKDINEFYGDYQAGEIADQRNPLVNFTEGDIEATAISDKEGK